MIVLDTNVVSETLRLKPDKTVTAWLAACRVAEMSIAAITVTELWYAAKLLNDDTHRTRLERKITDILDNVFAGRVVAFDQQIAMTCGQLMAAAKARNPALNIADLQIAATALVLGCPIATRNVRDFQHPGLKVINPWTD